MKKTILQNKRNYIVKTLLSFAMLFGVANAQFIGTAPSRNGSIGTNEYGSHTNGQNAYVEGGRTWYMTWDATNLYIAVASNSNAGADEMVLYIDTDPQTIVNGGVNANGCTGGIGNFDGNNYGVLPFRANFNAHIRNDYHQHRQSNNDNTWAGNTDNSSSITKTTIGNLQEVAIAWSLMGGRPSSFNFFFYLNGTNPYGGLSNYSSTTDNDQSSNTNLTGRQYFSVASTADGSSTFPFSRLSYVNARTTANTITGYGTSYYDVTLNAASTTSSLGADIAVSNLLLISSTNTLASTGAARNITFSGSSATLGLQCDGIISQNTNAVRMICSSGTTTLTGSATNTNYVLGNITVNNGATLTAPISGTIDIGLQAATLTVASTGTLNFVNGSGVVNITNSGATSTCQLANSGTMTFNNITNNTGNTLRPATSPATSAITIAGSLTNTGTFTTSNTGLLDVTMTGAGGTSIAAGTYQNLTISNTGSTSSNATGVTATNNITITSGKVLTISSGARFDIGSTTLDITGATSSINGFFRNARSAVPTGSSTSTLTFNNGGTYEHNRSGGTVPSATWNTGSTCTILGVAGNEPAGLNQSFFNFTWNCASQSSHRNLGGTLTTVTGTLSVLNTNGYSLRLMYSSDSLNGTPIGTYTANIANISVAAGAILGITGGTFATLNRVASNTTVTVSGSITINGSGIFDFNASTISSGDFATSTAILNLAGDLTMASTSIIRKSGSLTATFNFNKSSGNQTFTQSGGSITNTIKWRFGTTTPNASSPTVLFGSNISIGGSDSIVNNSTIDCQTFTFTFSGNPLSNFGTLRTANLSSTSIPTAYNWGGTVEFYGASTTQVIPQVTSYNNLTITGQPSVASALSINGNLVVSGSGLLSIDNTNNGRDLTIAGNVNIGGTGGVTRVASAGSTNSFILTGTSKTITCTSSSNNFSKHSITINTPASYSLASDLDYSSALSGRAISGTGTLDISGRTITLGNATFTVSTITTNASSVIDAKYSSGAVINSGQTWNGTFQYSNSSGGQTVVTGTYSNLTFSNTSGTNTLAGDISVGGTLSLNAGTLQVGANTLTISGNVPTRVSGNINASSGTLNFTNASAFTFPSGLFTGNILNLTVNGGGITFATSRTITGNLILTAGTLNTGATQFTYTGSNLTRTAGNIDASNASASLVFANTSPLSLPTSLFVNSITTLSTAGGSALVTLNSSNTVGTLTISGGDFTIAASYTLTLNTALTISANKTINVNGTLLNQSSGSLTQSGSMIVNNGGTYQHNKNAGTIPTATWNTGSTCSVTGFTSSEPSGLNQNFYNFTWNCAGQSGAAQLGGALTSVSNLLSIGSTNGSNVRLSYAQATSSTPYTGNFNDVSIAGGTLAIQGSVSNSGTTKNDAIINISGNLTFSGSGILDFNIGTAGNSATVNLAGNLTMSGATDNIIRSLSSGGTAIFNFAKSTGTQILTTNGGILGTTSSPVNFNVGTTSPSTVPTLQLASNATVVGSGTFAINNGSSIDCQTFILSNTTTAVFTLNTGTTLYSSNTNSTGGVTGSGTNGSIQFAGTRNYNGTVVYNGTSAQTIGAANYNNLTIAGGNRAAATVTLASSGTIGVAGTFSVTATNTNFTNTGSTVSFNNTNGGQSIPAFGYNNLTLANTSGTQTATSTIAMNGTLTLTSGGSFADAGNTITVGGNIAGTGTHTGAGKILMTGSGGTISGASLTNLELNNAGGFSLSGSPTINGTLTLNTGSLNINGNTLNLTNTPSIGTGNLSANGTGSTVVYTSAASTIPSGLFSSNAVKNFTVNRCCSVTMGSDLSITGVYTATSGKLDISGNTLTLGGTVSSMSGANSFIGSNSSKLTVTSTTTVGNVFFDQSTSADGNTTSGTNALKNIVVSGSGGNVTFGNKVNLFEQLSVTAGTLNTGDSLVLRSIAGTGTNNTAYVDQVGGTISGQVRAERYVHKQYRGWRAITAPVTYNGISQGYVADNWQNSWGLGANYGTRISGPAGGTGLDDTTVSASLMTYNSNTGAWNRISNTTTETIAGNAGGTTADNKSFFLFVRGDRTVTPNGYNPNAFQSTTLAARGNLQTGQKVFNFSAVSGGANKAWLVGNPYACPVDLSTVTYGGSVPDFIYVWDPNRPSSYSDVTGAYVTFDKSSNWSNPNPNAGTTTKYLQSGQCFFVVPTTTTASVTFNETDKIGVIQNNQTAGIGNGLADVFNVKLHYVKADGSKPEIDGIRAKFGANYSASVDADDAYKWSTTGLENMSLSRNNASLVIEARPYITTTDTLFFNITNLAASSNYEFKLNPINFDASVSSCKLVDKFLNTETPISLTNTSLIGFNVTSVAGSNAASRFYVVFNAAGSLPTNNSLTVKAYKQNNAIKVDWEAIAENNVKSYKVEKSIDATSFSSLINSETTAKNGNTTNAYSIIDNAPVMGVNYYRIQSVATNNNKVYSTVVRVEMTDKGIKSVTVYPNPVKSNTNTIGLQMNNLTAGKYTARIYNAAGQEVYSSIINHNGNNGSTSISLNKTLASGSYQLQLTDLKGNNYQQSVMVVD